MLRHGAARILNWPDRWSHSGQPFPFHHVGHVPLQRWLDDATWGEIVAADEKVGVTVHA